MGFTWAGRSFGSLEVTGIEPESVASIALETALDTVLEGMGEDGDHPGPLVRAHAETHVVPGGWLLRLVDLDGQTLRQALWLL